MHAPGWLFVVLAVLCVSGCGYVGDPLPPALMIPVPPAELTAVQQGEELVIECRLSAVTTDGFTLDELGALDVRLGDVGTRPFNEPTWANNASAVPHDGRPEPGFAKLETPAAPWTGREVVIGARVSNPKGRWSEWSNLTAVAVVEPVDPPSDLTAESLREGIRLSWRHEDERPGLRYRVLRRDGAAETSVLAAETADLEWLDAGVEYGASYEYRVQALAPAGERFAESLFAGPVTVARRDTFPPEAPQGVKAVAGFDTIELTWEPCAAEDLAFYRVYKAGPGNPSERVADQLPLPRFSDPDVTAGNVYRYTVTAVDRDGNESEPSPPVEQVAPQGGSQ